MIVRRRPVTSNSISTSPAGADVEDFAAAAVLDPLDAGLAVLVDQRHPVALADAVVDAGHRDFEIAEFAALCTEVLGAGVEPADLLV